MTKTVYFATVGTTVRNGNPELAVPREQGEQKRPKTFATFH